MLPCYSRLLFLKPLVSNCFQLNRPELVEGLVLINVDPCAKGWIDWAASKVRVQAWQVRVHTPGKWQEW